MSASASVSQPNALTPWPVYSANIFTSPYECFSFPFIVSYMPHLITEPNMISTENDRWGGGGGGGTGNGTCVAFFILMYGVISCSDITIGESSKTLNRRVIIIMLR